AVVGGQLLEAILGLRQRVAHAELLRQVEALLEVARDRALAGDALPERVVASLDVLDRAGEVGGGLIAADDPGDDAVAVEDEKRREGGDVVAPRQVRAVALVLGVETEENHAVGGVLEGLRGDDVLLELVAPAAPLGPEVDE